MDCSDRKWWIDREHEGVMDSFKTLKEQKETISLFMEYAVPGEFMEQAATLLDRYEADKIGLNLFHNFYSNLYLFFVLTSFSFLL